MILLIAALAQAAPSVPSAETLRKYPPVVMVAPPAPPAPPPSFDLLSPAGRALVKAQDAKVAAYDSAERERRVGPMEEWVAALNAERFEPARVARAGAAVDSALGRQGVFAGWAEVLARLSPDDRKVLAPHLNSSSGRVYYHVPSPPMIKLPSAAPEAQRTPLNQGMARLFTEMGRQEPQRTARRLELERARVEANEILRRKPFDAAAAKTAFRRAAALRNATDNLTMDATIDVLSEMPVEQRDAVIDAMWEDPRVKRLPPVLNRMPAPPAPRTK